MNCLDALRENPFLKTVPEPQLDWLVAQGECRSYGTADVPYRPGDAIDHLLVVLEGRIRVYTLQGGQPQEIFFIDTHALAGVLPFSRMRESKGFWQVLEPVSVLALHRSCFREMIQTQYELTEALVHQMTTRVRETTQQMQQNDKIMSLGRLSAGLAHELNNPVAAVVRSADTLREHLGATPEAFKAVMAIRLTDAQVDTVNELLFERIRTRPAEGLSLLERSRREDELTDWLDDHDVPNALDLSPSLVDFGFGTADLDRVLDQTGPAHVGTVLGWLVNNLVTEKLVLDIGEASGRIATLVGSIKSYTHMDRGTAREPVRLREGLESTLTLLQHKLKQKHIRVEVEVPDDLPVVSGWPGELNQVWTNLIDNAIDALADGGTLRIRAELDRRSDGSAFVLTHVSDDGAGIPPDVLDKIFDPFFTTKPIGQGTGLGLDIVQGLVRHHQGSIRVASQPGQTTFTVCLPILNE